MLRATDTHEITIVPARDAARVVPLSIWEKLVHRSANPYVLYQSPAWWAHLCCTGTSDGLFIAIVRNRTDKAVVGIVPLSCNEYSLKLHVKTRIVFKACVPAVFLLGSDPLLPEHDALYGQLIESIWSAFPHCRCVFIRSVAASGHFGQCLRSSREIRRHALVYAPEGARSLHLIAIPHSFDEYLSDIPSKECRDFKRRLRRLDEHAHGRLNLVRVDCEDQIAEFVRIMALVSHNSWQHQTAGVRLPDDREHRARIADLARRGILRSYLLTSADEHYAFLLGYQFLGVYYAVTTGYDQAMRHLSPGKLLFYLVIEDLTRHDPPRLFNFDVTEMKYKEDMGNRRVADAAFLLFQRSWANRILVASHASGRMFLECLKTMLRRRAHASTRRK